MRNTITNINLLSLLNRLVNLQGTKKKKEISDNKKIR